jgi:hypothetical protein
MWKIATIVCAIGVILGPIVTEVLREVIHRHRERRDGLGGTQDVAMWGTFATFICLVEAGDCGMSWMLTR